MMTGNSRSAHSIVRPTLRSKRIAGSLVVFYALITMVPLVWVLVTSFRADSTPATMLSEPSPEAYLDLFVDPSRNPMTDGVSEFGQRFVNSAIIGLGSTFLSILLGTFAAYGISRFKVPMKGRLLFLILSTRLLPPVALAIPIYLLYRTIGLLDTYLGMILIYTAVNISLAVWLLKSFIDQIPREHEEAAMIEGYTRLQAIGKVVLPQARNGIAVTAIFCFIIAWNEYAFAVLLASDSAQTAPAVVRNLGAGGGGSWSTLAAGIVALLIPIVVLTVLARKHLVRAMTFGAVRK